MRRTCEHRGCVNYPKDKKNIIAGCCNSTTNNFTNWWFFIRLEYFQRLIRLLNTGLLLSLREGGGGGQL